MESDNSQDAMRSPCDGLVQISIVEDDVWALSSKFESDLLEVALRSSLHDFTADEGRPGERDLLDVGVRGEGATGNAAVPGDDVDGTRWEPSFVDELCHADRSKGREL